MIIQGKLFAETPIYRGNARKTIFTRDGDGTQRLVSLAGEVSGTAQALMDAFIGKSRDNKNIGLVNLLWLRLYGAPMPDTLINMVDCHLREECYNKERFFDLRVGIRLDEDRWAMESNSNYKMETLFKNSVFDFSMNITDKVLEAGENSAKLYYVLQELKGGRFWFGAGKSKGLGRCRLEMDIPFSPPNIPTQLSANANHLTVSLAFDTENPVLVGWHWGKLDAEIPSFVSVEGRLLAESVLNIPEPIYNRLVMTMGGPILNPEDWKKKLTVNLPKAIAAWLIEHSVQMKEICTLPSESVAKLAKGEYPVPKEILEQLKHIVDQPFPSREAIEVAFKETLGEKDAKQYRRILDVLKEEKETVKSLDKDKWLEVANSLGLNPELAESLGRKIENESALVEILAEGCKDIMPQLYQQIDKQIKLLQSDSWIDAEITNRKEHMRIKMMLLERKITEQQWGNPLVVPKGVKDTAWREFLSSHSHVRYHHILNAVNLKKSIRNDMITIDFLKGYRNLTRRELTQPYNTDFRAGGISNREVSREYGKPYDEIFMRMLSWVPSLKGDGTWEIYIPGSTIKGAFRRRASQILKTLWGESAETVELLNRLFGTQRQKGIVLFSDAYLKEPDVHSEVWCSMDGVKMNSSTGKPIEEAKADYLFAYGDKLAFNIRIDIQDINKRDLKVISLLSQLIQDFEKGDIPLGGEKSSGFGWVRGVVKEVSWLSTNPDGITHELFGKRELKKDGIWYRLNLKGDDGVTALKRLDSAIVLKKTTISKGPHRAVEGFISHRFFGGYCGTLSVEAEVLTPLSIQESGEPSYKTTLNDGPVNGWDFFSISPPEADLRTKERVYAIPSKSIKGMIRHIYTIASNSSIESPDISRLNPTDSLFGWVGKGPNQAIMGRLSFSFGIFQNPEIAWFKVPYPYGGWQFTGEKWQKVSGGYAPILSIGKKWRMFPNTPLSPCVEMLSNFEPDTVQADYMRAIMSGGRCIFTLRFWNLEKEELQRLIWCLNLEDGLAHKIGRHRYLGFGSLRLHIMPESFLIDWDSRYTKKDEEKWKIPISLNEWFNPKVIRYYDDLKKILDAKRL